jgi:hypothetical protein
MNIISLNSNWKFELNKSMEKIKLYCCGESAGKVVARGKPVRQRTGSRGAEGEALTRGGGVEDDGGSDSRPPAVKV